MVRPQIAEICKSTESKGAEQQTDWSAVQLRQLLINWRNSLCFQVLMNCLLRKWPANFSNCFQLCSCKGSRCFLFLAISFRMKMKTFLTWNQVNHLSYRYLELTVWKITIKWKMFAPKGFINAENMARACWHSPLWSTECIFAIPGQTIDIYNFSTLILASCFLHGSGSPGGAAAAAQSSPLLIQLHQICFLCCFVQFYMNSGEIDKFGDIFHVIGSPSFGKPLWSLNFLLEIFIISSEQPTTLYWVHRRRKLLCVDEICMARLACRAAVSCWL